MDFSGQAKISNFTNISICYQHIAGSQITVDHLGIDKLKKKKSPDWNVEMFRTAVLIEDNEKGKKYCKLNRSETW